MPAIPVAEDHPHLIVIFRYSGSRVKRNRRIPPVPVSRRILCASPTLRFYVSPWRFGLFRALVLKTPSAGAKNAAVRPKQPSLSGSNVWDGSPNKVKSPRHHVDTIDTGLLRLGRPTMADAVRVICPNLRCRAILSVPMHARGKTVRCRQCGMRVRIPAPSGGSPAPKPASSENTPEDE